jgi:thiamine-monophosphate kinase
VKRLADLGERAAIRRIAAILTKGTNSMGIGDDCAAIDLGKDYLLVTTDMMNQRTHIPAQMTPYQMGWFLVAINLSDIAAKGGTPLGLVLSFGFPKKTSELFLKKLIKGADACAVTFGTTIVGGDTKESQEIMLCGTAFGTVKKNEFMPRTGARPGDVVAVTGTLGKAGAGYYALKRRRSEKKLVKALLEPVPKLKEGRLLAKQHYVTSSMDVSDGLSTSLYQLHEINNVGFEINKNALPLASELSLFGEKNHDIDPYSLAMHFGGDYELLVTISAEAIGKAQKTLRRHSADLTVIGTVTKNKYVVLFDGKNKRIFENKGYEHFKKHYF